MSTFPLHQGATVVSTPAWRISIAGHEVTREVTELALSVEYTDHLHGKSDEVAVTFENRDGRWTSGWSPAKGDEVELQIGYVGEPLLPCGVFEIDAFDVQGPPDVFILRGLAARISVTARTRRTAGYEALSLREIAEGIAQRHQLQVVGDIDDVHIDRSTQQEESDLSYLTALARRYGHVFSIRGSQLIFYRLAGLEAGQSVITLNRGDLGRYQLGDQTRAIYRACKLSYTMPSQKATIHETVEAEGITTGDVLRITGQRVESRAQALAQATAALRNANRDQAKGTLEFTGVTRAVAGNAITAVGFGHLDGKYLIEEARHRLSRADGYRTSIEVKRV